MSNNWTVAILVYREPLPFNIVIMLNLLAQPVHANFDARLRHCHSDSFAFAPETCASWAHFLVRGVCHYTPALGANVDSHSGNQRLTGITVDTAFDQDWSPDNATHSFPPFPSIATGFPFICG